MYFGKTANSNIGYMQKLCRLAFMASLIGAGAFVYLPIGPVPVTFQDFFVVLAGLALGAKRGALAVLLYILAGALGLPIFSGGRAGLGHLLSPTAGYLAGFVFLAFFSGLGACFTRKFMEKTAPTNDAKAKPEDQKNIGEEAEFKSSSKAEYKSSSDSTESFVAVVRENLYARYKPLAIALAFVLLGLVCLYFFGAIWLSHSLEMSFAKAFSVGVLPFLPFGISKSLLAVLLWDKLIRRGILPR